MITASNSSGKAVVQYFSGQADEQPDACGSFVCMIDLLLHEISFPSL